MTYFLENIKCLQISRIQKYIFMFIYFYKNKCTLKKFIFIAFVHIITIINISNVLQSIFRNESLKIIIKVTKKKCTFRAPVKDVNKTKIN